MATVLLVDNTDSFVELERFFLEGHGHQVVTARCGEDVFARLDAAHPDILLIDLNLSDIGGDEVCRRLRRTERWRALPVIIVTSSSREEEVRRCLDAGCDDYLTKPVVKSDLVEKVQRLLGKVRRRTAERAPIPLKVQLKSGEHNIQARARDISSNGIYVSTQTVLAPGTVVEMKLELPSGGTLPVLGKVKRAQDGPDGGMGIYFIHPEPQGQKVLSALIDQERGKVTHPTPPREEPSRMDEEAGRMRRRIQELEDENRDFADQIIRIEEINNLLSNLYVATSRLYAVLDRAQVAGIINEVVINFIGAEKFALLIFDRESGELRYETGEGFEEFPPLRPQQGVWREVMEESRSSFREEAVAQGSDDLLRPIAAIPLRIREETIGVLAVYRLFVHKESFAPIDYQLFSMLAEHAAGALFSSILYEESERKQKTYRGFMDLLLK